MWPRCPLLWIFLSLAGSVCLVGKATAEILAALLPDGVPGYDTSAGIVVRTRLHDDQFPSGLRDGPLTIKPTLVTSIGYDTNVMPGASGKGSWTSSETPSVALASEPSGASLGAVVSVDSRQYLADRGQNWTDSTLSAGGRIDSGEHQLTVAIARLGRHEARGALDTIASDQPVRFVVDDIRIEDTFTDGRWQLAPSVELTRWTYDSTTIGGAFASQAYRDRIVLQGSLALRYEVVPLRQLLLVLRGIDQDYTDTPAGQVSPNSRAFRILAGLSDQADPLWHWRLLLGEEFRRFQSSFYPGRDTFIAEAGLTWSPSSLTTVSAIFARETDAAAQEGVSGMVYTLGRVGVDHELRRDLFLSAVLGWQRQDYFQGGYQTGFRFGIGAVWTLSRMARISWTWDQIDLRGSSEIAGSPSPSSIRGLGLMTVSLAL